jgi:hypothetical protein
MLSASGSAGPASGLPDSSSGRDANSSCRDGTGTPSIPGVRGIRTLSECDCEWHQGRAADVVCANTGLRREPGRHPAWIDGRGGDRQSGRRRREPGPRRAARCRAIVGTRQRIVDVAGYVERQRSLIACAARGDQQTRNRQSNARHLSELEVQFHRELLFGVRIGRIPARPQRMRDAEDATGMYQDDPDRGTQSVLGSASETSFG